METRTNESDLTTIIPASPRITCEACFHDFPEAYAFCPACAAKELDRLSREAGGPGRFLCTACDRTFEGEPEDEDRGGRYCGLCSSLVQLDPPPLDWEAAREALLHKRLSFCSEAIGHERADQIVERFLQDNDGPTSGMSEAILRHLTKRLEDRQRAAIRRI